MPANTFVHDETLLHAARVPYVPVTVRVPERMAAQVKELAESSGWQLADYLRTLICLGAVFFSLSYGNHELEEAANELMGGLKLLKLPRGFSLHFSKRPYAFRLRGRKSTLTSLSLPNPVCDLISIYANLKNASRNKAYYRCLEQGLLIYLKAQGTILHASRDQVAASGPLA